MLVQNSSNGTYLDAPDLWPTDCGTSIGEGVTREPFGGVEEIFRSHVVIHSRGVAMGVGSLPDGTGGLLNQPANRYQAVRAASSVRSPSNPTRVLITDDHELIRRGLQELLRFKDGFEICGEATDGREAVEKVKQLKPDVVCLDLSMPLLNGLEATRQIRKMSPETEVLILTVHESEQMIWNVLEAGARGYLLKSDAARDLTAAIDSLSQHRPFFTSRVSRMVLEGFLSTARKEQAPPGLPSAREREIVQLLAEGKSNKEVAVVLGISVKTAETHRNRIMRKLKLSSICDLVHYAVRNNIVEP
jgi:DNA-binding NarL/FixJ family response regulator